MFDTGFEEQSDDEHLADMGDFAMPDEFELGIDVLSMSDSETIIGGEDSTFRSGATAALPPSTSIEEALAVLEAETQGTRLENNQNLMSGRTTTAYAAQIKRYSDYWDLWLASKQLECPSYPSIAAHPITPLKAALFVEHEFHRPKVRTSSSRF